MRTAPSVLFWPGVDVRIACDLIDLPRLRLCIKNNGGKVPEENIRILQNTDVAERIKFITNQELQEKNISWNAVALTASELVSIGLENLLGSLSFKWLVISDGLDSVEEEQRKRVKETLAKAGFEKGSDNLDAYYWKDKSLWGEVLFSEKRITEAFACFEQVLSEDPSHLNALNNLGVISYQFGQLDATEKFLIKAVRLDRRNINALINLSHVYFKMERFSDAAELFQEASSLDEGNASVWFHLGLCYEQSGRNSEALEAYNCCNDLGDNQWPVSEKIESLEKFTAHKIPKKICQPILSPKKILVINNLYPPQEFGGFGRRLCDFANILERRGHSIRVLTSNAPSLGEITQNEPNVDRSLILFGGWENGVLKTIEDKRKTLQIVKKNHKRVQQIKKDFSPDLCLCGNIDLLSHSVFQHLLESGIPVIHHLGNQYPGYSVQDSPQSDLYRLAAVSHWLKDAIVGQGYPFREISVIYPGALVKEFKMPVLPATDKLRIAYASLVLPYKGPHVLLGALKRLHDMGIDFSCSIAGTAANENFVNHLKNIVISNGMGEKVQFLGFLPREELKNFFARHNVLAFPSVFQEPFGHSQVYAMAAGLTVVTSGTGGAKEIVEHGVSGIIFRSENDASLAQALLELLRDPLRWQQIAAAGQERAFEYFDIEKSVDVLEEKYQYLLNKKRILTNHM